MARQTATQLPPRQARFVLEYLVDLNGTRAAKRSGYKHAEHQASRLLAKPAIAKAIKEAMASRAARVRLTQDRVLEELKTLAFSNVEHYVVDGSGHVKLAPGAPPDAMRAISSIKCRPNAHGVEVEIRLWDKPGTLKLAGRHLGIAGFFDRLEVASKDGEAVRFVIEHGSGGHVSEG